MTAYGVVKSGLRSLDLSGMIQTKAARVWVSLLKVMQDGSNSSGRSHLIVSRMRLTMRAMPRIHLRSPGLGWCLPRPSREASL